MAGGRPTKYTKELADEICIRIAHSSRGLNHHCKALKINPDTVFKWLLNNKEFAENYARAREAQADFLADEILDISDHNDKDTVKMFDKHGNELPTEDKEWTNRSRLRVDARKWVASKLKPKKYGDKVELSGDKDNPLVIQQITGMEVK